MNTFKTFLLICAVVLGSVSCDPKSGNRDASRLFPFPPSRGDFGSSDKTKHGYMNIEGFLVIEQQFDYADDFHEGLAHVRVGNKHGYIDTQGKFVINPQFDWAWRFYEGLALVKSDDKHGYIEKSGKYVINPQFDYADSFSDGLARVRVGDKFGYIDKSGNYVINPQFNRAGSFHEGLAIVEVGSKNVESLREVLEVDSNCGFIDKSGKIVIDPQFDCPFSMKDDSGGSYGVFSEGLAGVKVVDKSDKLKGKYGYINKTGNFVIPPQFDYALEFSEGLAAVGFNVDLKAGAVELPYPVDEPTQIDPMNPRVWGFIDRTGKYVINPRFTIVKGFSEGLSVACLLMYECGYIDKTGKYVILPKFVDCESFSNGVADGVWRKNRNEESYEGFVFDKSGKIIHPRNRGQLGSD